MNFRTILTALTLGTTIGAFAIGATSGAETMPPAPVPNMTNPVIDMPTPAPETMTLPDGTVAMRTFGTCSVNAWLPFPSNSFYVNCDVDGVNFGVSVDPMSKGISVSKDASYIGYSEDSLGMPNPYGNITTDPMTFPPYVSPYNRLSISCVQYTGISAQARPVTTRDCQLSTFGIPTIYFTVIIGETELQAFAHVEAIGNQTVVFGDFTSVEELAAQVASSYADGSSAVLIDAINTGDPLANLPVSAVGV